MESVVDSAHANPEIARYQMTTHFDVLVIGSGFGGSVAALRLTEKGYRVGVLEAGARFEDTDFPKTSWHLSKYLFFPRLGFKGVQRMHFLKDVVVLAGAGVGGGSLNYANTLYQPGVEYFQDPIWSHITNWQTELEPCYDQARRMLGVVPNPFTSPADEVMHQVSVKIGREHTYQLTPVGVFFGEGEGVTVSDPFFGGAGPERTGCTNCGECMTGCRFNAKNTLPKNYLGLAEKAGATVLPLTEVLHLEETETKGWRVTARKTGTWLPLKKTFSADQVIVAAGTYNTQKLLHRQKATGRLPSLSGALGNNTRTNSESLVGAVGPRRKGLALHRGSAITSSIYLDDHTHVEPCRYGVGSNAMALLATPLPSGATPAARRKSWLKNLAKRPQVFFKMLDARGWSERTVIALVMQNLPSALQIRTQRGIFGWQLKSTPDLNQPAPKTIAQADEVAKRIAEEIGGEPMAAVTELFGAPITAHFTGGCVISDNPRDGVIDAYHRVWNYPTLHVVDGSTVSANLGVNPSLTITAQAERAFSLWPNRGESDPRPKQGAIYQRLTAIKPIRPVVSEDAPGALRIS